MIKIFLVEDEMIIRRGIKNSIEWEKEGYQFVGEASDGELALPMIIREKPDIVMTDIKMPFMDGLAFIKELRGFMPDVPVIILSGFSDFEYAKEAIRYQVSNYLLKPVSTEELALTLIELKEKLDEKFDKKTSAGNSEGYYSKLVENIKRSVLRNFSFSCSRFSCISF